MPRNGHRRRQATKANLNLNHNITVPTCRITMPAEFKKRQQRQQIMLARIRYAARGWRTFPAVIGRAGAKMSLKSEAQFDTKWGQTLDEETIRREFTVDKFRDQIIGLPTGIENGFIVVDSDTAEHGKDGEAALKKWERKHGKLPGTLEAELPSGSRHRYFRHPGEGIKVKNSIDIFGEGSGVDVRGDKGMVLAPPSPIKARPAKDNKPAKVGGVYRWLNDHEIAEAPQALLNLIVDKEPPKEKTRKSKATGNERNSFQREGDELKPQADKAEVKFALQQIPLTISYDIWMEIGAAIGDEFGDAEGRKIFEPWSMQSKKKYNTRTFAKKWKDFLKMTEFGIGTVFHYASIYNPNWRDEWEVIQLSGVQPQKSKSKSQTKNKKSKLIKTSKTIRPDLFYDGIRYVDEDELEDEAEAVPGIIAKPFVLRDPKSIPRRDWLYGRHLIRKFASATIAAGGVGKSSLMLIRALALVTGRPLLGVQIKKRCRVWYWNGEDPYEEIERRIAAACLHYGIKPEEIEGRLFINSGRVDEIVIARQGRNGAVVAEPVVEALHATITQMKIDVVMIDPFISSHRVSENDNNANRDGCEGLDSARRRYQHRNRSGASYSQAQRLRGDDKRCPWCRCAD